MEKHFIVSFMECFYDLSILYQQEQAKEVYAFKEIMHFMSYSTYRQLPQESLNELLCMAVKDMLATIDANEDGEIGFKAKRKQVELLLDIIDEKAIEKSTASNEFK